MATCPTCGKDLNTEQGTRQHHTKVHGEPLPNRTWKGCGSEFYDPKARLKFCDDCNPEAGEHNGNWKDASETAECERCGEEFEYYPSEKKGVYCPTCVAESEEFLGEAREVDAERVTESCKQCGETMEVLRSDWERDGRTFCSLDCYGEWLSEHRVGEDHHQWKGGDISYGGEWWSVRRKARERDDHRCQRCGKTKDEIGREPDVHHIEPVREFDDPADAHRLDNVVCLCRSCHRTVESG
ncbi:MAG: HNH endonuclease [Halobacteriales archaeon]